LCDAVCAAALAGGECPVFVGFVWSADSVVQSWNKIGDEGAKAIGAALQVNTSVQKLRLVS
jgi:hypothetical protein